MRDEAHVGAAEPRLLAAPLVRGREREPHPRVARDERAQLASGVATGAKDSNRDSMHDECILLHQGDVNRYWRRSGRIERGAPVLPLGYAPCYRLVDRTEEVGWINGNVTRQFSSWSVARRWGARKSFGCCCTGVGGT